MMRFDSGTISTVSNNVLLTTEVAGKVGVGG
jgi:hypothetical protein